MQLSISNKKAIRYFLQIACTILFAVSIFCIFKPIQAQAATSPSWYVDADGNQYVYIPGRIYWGGSTHRTGLLFYCVDKNTGAIDESTINVLYNNDNGWTDEANLCGTTRIGNKSLTGLPIYCFEDLPDTGDWDSDGGSPIKAWLEDDSETIYNGAPLCNAANLVFRYTGASNLQKVLSGEYTICFEGMYGLAIYMYKSNKDIARCFSRAETIRRYGELSDDELAELSIIKWFTTLRYIAYYCDIADIHVDSRYGERGTANYKWIQSCAKYFSTTEDHFGVPAAHSSNSKITAQDILNSGWNFAVVENTTDTPVIVYPPIHTFDGTNTPGNTEIPSPANGTDGDCTIKKLYYTQMIASDGTILTEATDYYPFTQTLTTNYISIDTEDGYEIEGWKASASSSNLNTKEQFNSISATHNGTSSQEITLDEATGEKYLYILYKKIEVLTSPSDPWDFQLNQSQITKRVTFLESNGPANTPDLITHAFTWAAPAPTQTTCTAHGGYGHHLYCIRVWDRAPVDEVPHQHLFTCYTLICLDTSPTHIHALSCYSLSCSIVKAVVSKNWSVTYNAPTVNTIEFCLTHMGLFFCNFLDIEDTLEFQIQSLS